MAGKDTEARQTFKRVVDEFPQSSYATAARREIETLADGTVTSGR